MKSNVLKTIGSHLLAGLVLISLAACKEGPTITVGGTTLSESDLEKEQPQQYASLKKEYNEKVLEGLQSLATQKLFELEARELGKGSAQEYIAELRAKTPPPSDEALSGMYDNLKNSGRLPPGSTFADMKDSIRNFMVSQSSQDVVRAEVGRLKKKYNYRVNQEITRQEVDVAGEPVRLNDGAKITIVEFSDFECPFCIRVQGTAKEVRAKYGDKIKWVFKDFPLTSIHPQAMSAHIAANCVHKQDQAKFWTFFDTIFASDRPDNILEADQLRKLALAQGVKADQFDSCLKDPAMRQEVEKDMEEGQAVGVNGTPAFFINGRFINGAVPFEDFEQIIEEELAN